MDIKEIIDEIKKLENYCVFYKATKRTFGKTNDLFGEMPKDMQEFYKNFNGGFIFGYNFSSITGENTHYSFETLNNDEYKRLNRVPENVIVFADTGYGDLVGYNKDNKRIIQINPEEDEEKWFNWDNFTQFLEEFLKESIKLIDDGILDELR